MAAGRCAGCGKTGSACKINTHILTCEKWLALYQSDRARALDAAAEHIRWKEQDQAAERTERREAVAVQGEAARAASLSRFSYRDILEDE